MVKECVHIDTGRYYAAKVINKRLMAGREHMVRTTTLRVEAKGILVMGDANICFDRCATRLQCSKRCQWATRTY